MSVYLRLEKMAIYFLHSVSLVFHRTDGASLQMSKT